MVPHGLSLAEIVQAVGLSGNVRLILNDQAIPPQHWGVVRPGPGSHIIVRPVPTDGDKSAGRIIATIAVAAAAAYTGGAVASAVGGKGLASAAASAAVGYAGMWAVNQLFPPPDGDSDSDRPRDQVGLSGTRNQMRPYEPIRRIFGRHKVYPDLAARPYTEMVGQDQYLRMLLCVGYGPLDISDIKIGETPIDNYSDVEYQVRDLSAGDNPPSLYTNTVTQEGFDVRLEQDGDQAGSWHERTTEPDTDEISLELTYPAGLKELQSSGDQRKLRTETFVQYREVGSSSWIDLPASAEVTGPGTRMPDDGILITSRKKFGLFRVGVRWEVPRGQYEVRLRRYRTWNLEGGRGELVDSEPPAWRVDSTAEDDDGNTVYWYLYKTRTEEPSANGQAICNWTGLKSIKHESPLGDGAAQECVYIALRIRATDQLNGTVDQLNCIAHSKLPVYDGNQWTAPQPTRNAAWAFAAVHRDNAYGVPDNKIDGPALKAWADHLDSLGFTFDTVLEERQPVQELAQKIASAGRAQVTRTDDFKVSVVVDQERTNPVQVFSPRNIIAGSFSSTRNYAEELHGVKVQFANPDQGWQRDERTVYHDGYDANNATRFETIRLLGCTDEDQAWKHGRYWLAVQQLRPETYSWESDFEALICQRGDLVRVQHDVPMWGLASGRIKSVATDGNGDVTEITLDETVTMEAGEDYGVRVRLSDGSSVTADVVTIAELTTEDDETLTTEDGEVLVVHVSGRDEGDHQTLTLSEPVSGPDVGDLCLFGQQDSESVELVIKDIEYAGDYRVTITALDHSPAIYQADTGEIPAFDSQITVPDEFALRAPQTPVITDITSDDTVLRQAQDGSLQERIRISVDVPESADRPEPVAYELQWRRAEGLDDFDDPDAWERERISDPQRLYCDPVDQLIPYDVRVATISEGGYISDWATVEGHMVIGKTAPPDDVQSFTAQQNRELVTFKWSRVKNKDRSGYEIRFKSPTVYSWESANLVTRETRGTLVTNAAIPPGTWRVGIKAVDTSGNYSINDKTSDITVINEFDLIEQTQEHPAWTGQIESVEIAELTTEDDETLTTEDGEVLMREIPSAVVHDVSGRLVPNSLRMANDGGFDIFDNFVIDPVETLIYTAKELDTQFDDDVRAWADMDASLGPGETGQADPEFYLNHRIDGGEYTGFETWAIGTEEARYFKGQIRMDTEDGVGYVERFEVVADMLERRERFEDFTITGTTTLAYNQRFHLKPNVAITPSNDAVFPIHRNRTTESVDIELYDSSGAQVNGTVDVVVTGV